MRPIVMTWPLRTDPGETTGLGTRFTFTIPVAEQADSSVADSPGHARRAGRQQPHVLVVDDDPQALAYVRGILQDAGYGPLVTGEPEQVAGLIDTHQPDLVLLDLRLPGTDGIELMQ